MKLFRKLSTALALLLVLSLTSCESFFFTNLFAGARPKPKPSEMSTSELKESLDSKFFMAQVQADPELREEVKAVLKATYEDPATSPAEQELAAATYATVVIKSDPAADHVVNSAVTAYSSIESLRTAADPQAAAVDVIISVMPQSIVQAIETSSQPPQEFVVMLQSFVNAGDALAALGSAAPGGVLDTDQLSDSDKFALAVSAAVSTFITASTPVDVVNDTPAEALWMALKNPGSASAYITFDQSSLDYEFSSGSLYNLLLVAGL